jgi:branched-chain amino acid transport system permease protein
MNAMISRSTRASKLAGFVAIALVAFLVAVPWLGDVATERLIGEFMVYLALASLWNLLAGYTGLVSVGQQTFVGFGAYVVFSLALLAGWNPLYAVPMAGIATAFVAIPVAKIVFRLQGAYFAIGTWVVAEVFRLGFAQLSILGGGSGKSMPANVVKQIAETKFWREATIYWLAVFLGIGTLVLVYSLLRSRIGLALTAIRDNETASVSLGIRIERVKYLVYIVVAGMTGLVGALFALQKIRITPDAAFSVNDWTAFVIFIVVIGGIGTIEGPLVGTIVYFLLREFLADLGSIYLLILGVLAIGVMLTSPKGLWGFVQQRFELSLFPTGFRVVPKEETIVAGAVTYKGNTP